MLWFIALAAVRARLVEQAGAQRAHSALCERSVGCLALGDGRAGLQELVQASDEDTEAFLASVGLGGQSFTCHDLCVAVLAQADASGLALPPAPGVQCPDAACAGAEPVDPAELAAGAEQALEDRSPDELEGREGEAAAGEAPGPALELAFTPAELLLQLLAVFDLLPVPPQEPPGDFLAAEGEALLQTGEAGGRRLVRSQRDPVKAAVAPTFSAEVRKERYATWRKIHRESLAVMSAAIRRSGTGDFKRLVQRYLGDAPTAQVKRTLQATLKVMLHLHITAGSKKCGLRGLVAHVDTLKATDTVVLWNERQHLSRSSRYVVHVCERFWYNDVPFDTPYKFGLLIHEATHHLGTSDLAYGKKAVLQLAKEQGAAAATRNADSWMRCALALAAWWRGPQKHGHPVQWDGVVDSADAFAPGRENGFKPHAKCNTACGASQYQGNPFATSGGSHTEVELPGSGFWLTEQQCARCAWVDFPQWKPKRGPDVSRHRNGFPVGDESAFGGRAQWPGAAWLETSATRGLAGDAAPDGRSPLCDVGQHLLDLKNVDEGVDYRLGKRPRRVCCAVLACTAHPGDT